MPRARERTATAVTNGVLKSVRKASFRWRIRKTRRWVRVIGDLVRAAGRQGARFCFGLGRWEVSRSPIPFARPDRPDRPARPVTPTAIRHLEGSEGWTKPSGRHLSV